MRTAAIVAGVVGMVGLFLLGLWAVGITEEEHPASPPTAAAPAPPPEEPAPRIVAELIPPPAPSAPVPSHGEPTLEVTPPRQDAESRPVVTHYGDVPRDREALRRQQMECVDFFKQQAFEKALECFKDVLAKDPSETRLHSQIGAVLAKLGRKEEAAWHYNQFVLLNPKHHQARAASEILEQWWSSDGVAWEGSGAADQQPPATPESPEPLRRCRILYEEAYVIKNTQLEAAIAKLKEAQGLCAPFDTPYNQKIRKLLERLERGEANP